MLTRRLLRQVTSGWSFAFTFGRRISTKCVLSAGLCNFANTAKVHVNSNPSKLIRCAARMSDIAPCPDMSSGAGIATEPCFKEAWDPLALCVTSQHSTCGTGKQLPQELKLCVHGACPGGGAEAHIRRGQREGQCNTLPNRLCTDGNAIDRLWTPWKGSRARLPTGDCI